MKRINAVLLSVVLLMSSITGINATTVGSEGDIQTQAGNCFEILKPVENELVAAGYFDITWTDDVEGEYVYDVYINDEYVATTIEKEYEHYSTDVKMHSVYVVAKDDNENIRETDKVSFGVSKKGLAVNNDMCKYINPVEMNVAWYYNWGTAPNGYEDFKGVEFVPMIWGPMFDDRIPEVAEQGYKYLLSYNEPDMGNDGGGCNTDVETVIANWPKFLGYDYYLGAPAPALSPSWESGTMFRNFMDNVDHDTVDFIPLHCYYGQWGGVDAAKSFLEDVVDATYEMYGKPIWVTEFAISGWPPNNDWAKNWIKEFLVETLKGLDERPYVERYTWFPFNTTDGYSGAAALWDHSNGEITELGKAYIESGNPEGYDYTKKDYVINESIQTEIMKESMLIGNVVYEDYLKDENVVVTASSETDGNGIVNIADKDINTSWKSESDTKVQTIYIDLGEVRNLKEIDVVWDECPALEYYVQISEDGVSYDIAAVVDNDVEADGRRDSITFSNMMSARYIRIVLTKGTTEECYSVSDMALYGTDVEKATVEILNYQYNTKNDGFRVISAIEPEIDGKAVVENGNIYGRNCEDNLKEKMVINSNSSNVYTFLATDKGISQVNYSDSQSANCFIMTMTENGTIIDAYNQEYLVRSYAILEDGTVVYGDIEEFSINAIADYLYRERLMLTEEEHQYLYNSILSVVNPNYVKVEY